MERFKLNDKDYFIEVKNNQECIITEFGNKDKQFCMSIEEMRVLKVDFNKACAFSDRGIVSNAINDINIASLSEQSVAFNVVTKGKISTFTMPIKDFCEDVMSAYLSPNKEDKCINEKMKNFKAALDFWKKESYVPFMGTKCAIYSLDKKLFGAGYFDQEKAVVISKCNLAIFNKVIIAIPYYASKAKLELVEKKSDYEYVYDLKSISVVKNMGLDESVAQTLDSFDLKDQTKHEYICKSLNLKGVSKVGSDLDNFFDI